MPNDPKPQTLTAAQEAAFKEVFGFFDVNQGGTITQQELYTRARQLGLSIEEWEVHEAMNEIDPQHLGHVSWEAFLNYMTSNQKYSETLTTNKPASEKVPKEALLFVAVSKFVQKHKYSSKYSKKARHMAEIERYYRAKAKHHPHVIGDFAAGWRLVGMTQREFHKHWVDLKSENTKVQGKASSSPYAQAPSMRLFTASPPPSRSRRGDSTRPRRRPRKHIGVQPREKRGRTVASGTTGVSGSSRSSSSRAANGKERGGSNSSGQEPERLAASKGHLPRITTADADEPPDMAQDAGKGGDTAAIQLNGDARRQQQAQQHRRQSGDGQGASQQHSGQQHLTTFSGKVRSGTAPLASDASGAGNKQTPYSEASSHTSAAAAEGAGSGDDGADDGGGLAPPAILVGGDGLDSNKKRQRQQLDHSATPGAAIDFRPGSGSTSGSGNDTARGEGERTASTLSANHPHVHYSGDGGGNNRRPYPADAYGFGEDSGDEHNTGARSSITLQVHESPRTLLLPSYPHQGQPRPPPWTTVSQDPQQKQLHRSRYHRRSYCLPHVPMRGGRRGPGAPPLKFTDLPEIRRKADEAKKSFLSGQWRKGETLLNEQWRKTRADAITSPTLKLRLRRTFQAYTGTARTTSPK